MDHSGWTLPSNANCPDIAFSVGGKFFAISGEDLKFADAGNGMSFGAIQSRGSNRQDILGDVSSNHSNHVSDTNSAIVGIP